MTKPIEMRASAPEPSGGWGSLPVLLPGITRRTLLTGIAATALAGAVGASAAAESAHATTAALPTVAPLPAGAPDRALFSPREQIFAGYLKILAPMANDIVTDGSALHGFMGGGWWRGTNPRNARIMEHVATLAWFHSNERPWNPYFGDPALGARLAAALEYYLSLQAADGTFPEGEEHSLAATGFGLVALSRALVEMRAAGGHYELRERMRAAIGKAAAWLLSTSSTGTIAPWGNPMWAANQTAAGLAGAAAAAEALGDDTMMATVRDRVILLGQRGQADGGWFWEQSGFDSGYNFGVQLPDMAELHARIGAADLARQADLWSEFFLHTLVPEPGTAGFFRFAAASTRTDATDGMPAFTPDQSDRFAFVSQFVASSPRLAAVLSAREDRDEERAAWAASADPVPARAKLDTSPRLWMHVSAAPALPTRAAQQAARNAMPQLSSSRFTRLRHDPHNQLDFLFVRRPSYYAAASFGQRRTLSMRHGLQLLWHPEMGTVVAGGNKSGLNNDFWATVLDNGADDARQTGLAHPLTPTYLDWDKNPITRDQVEALTGGFRVKQNTSDPAVPVQTITSFVTTGLRRYVQADRAGAEMIPFVLHPTDELSFFGTTTPLRFGEPADTTATGIRIARNGATATFRWNPAYRVTITPSVHTFFADAKRRRHIMHVHHPSTFELFVEFGTA